MPLIFHRLNDEPLKGSVLADARAVTVDALGSQIFDEACAGCHLPNGEGRQSPWASLRGDHDAGDPSAKNLVQVLAHGSQIATKDGRMSSPGADHARTNPPAAPVGARRRSKAGQMKRGGSSHPGDMPWRG
jgi:mono/diheme cytochrome c family protein